jgi:hypothetical protein
MDARSAGVIELHIDFGEIDRSDNRGMSGPFSRGLKSSVGPEVDPEPSQKSVAKIGLLLTSSEGPIAAQAGMRAMTLISKSKPASQFTPTAVQFG